MDMDVIHDIDTDLFIKEVKLRRAIWNSSCDEYNNQHIRKLQWKQVAKILAKETMVEEEINELERKLQVRWQNLRTCFKREMRNLSNVNNKKKKKYIFFDQLQFLLQDERYSSCYKSDAIETVDETVDSPTSDFITSLYTPPTPQEKKKKGRTKSNNFTAHEMSIINTINDSNNVSQREMDLESDSDKMFLLSLVEGFRQIPSHRKWTIKRKMVELIEEGLQAEDNDYPITIAKSVKEEYIESE